jgi:hypothetical protein
MIICLVKYFDLIILPTGIDQLFKNLYDLRPVEFRLLEEGPGHAECDFEVGILSNEIVHHAQCRQVTFFGDLEKDRPVGLFPEKFITLRMEPAWLMELKINGQ